MRKPELYLYFFSLALKLVNNSTPMLLVKHSRYFMHDAVLWWQTHSDNGCPPEQGLAGPTWCIKRPNEHQRQHSGPMSIHGSALMGQWASLTLTSKDREGYQIHICSLLHTRPVISNDVRQLDRALRVTCVTVCVCVLCVCVCVVWKE